MAEEKNEVIEIAGSADAKSKTVQMRYIFILRGQERLIKFCFLAVYTMLHDKNYVKK